MDNNLFFLGQFTKYFYLGDLRTLSLLCEQTVFVSILALFGPRLKIQKTTDLIVSPLNVIRLFR